jgi:hypothetical protein
VRTDPGAPSSGGGATSGGRYPRGFQPIESAPSSAGGVKFPPIGGPSPSTSPQPASANGDGAALRKPRASISGAAGRRPSEFGGGAVPSYMQSTDAHTNHLLAAEREEREKNDDVPSGRQRIPRGSLILTSPPSGGVGGPKSRLQDVNETNSIGNVGHGGHAPRAQHRPSVIKTPRARELTSGTTPAYMLETNSSRQRGSIKPQTDL